MEGSSPGEPDARRSLLGLRGGRNALDRLGLLALLLALVAQATAAGLLLDLALPWPLTVVQNLVHLLLALSLPSLALALFFRRFGRASLHLLSLLLGVALFAPRPGPPPEAQAQAAELSVVVFNLGDQLAWEDPTLSFLRESAADVVGLVEVSDAMAARFESELAELFPFQVLHPGGLEGKAILSRHPIAASEHFALEEGRRYLRATVRVDGRELEFLVVHYSPSIGFFGGRCAAGRDLRRLAQFLSKERPGLMVGDFNLTERSSEHRLLESFGLTDAFAASGEGPGFTFPMFGRYFKVPIGRFLRIDYAFSTDELIPLEARVGPDLGSDHRPLHCAYRWSELAPPEASISPVSPASPVLSGPQGAL